MILFTYKEEYMYGSNFGGYQSTSNVAELGVWGIIALVIAIIGGICLYFTVFSEKSGKGYKGFMAKFYDFIKFKKMFIVSFLKVLYLISAIYVTLVSFGLISTSFLAFILTLTLGNIFLRVVFEFSLVMLTIYENTNEINKKMK